MAITIKEYPEERLKGCRFNYRNVQGNPYSVRSWNAQHSIKEKTRFEFCEAEFSGLQIN